MIDFLYKIVSLEQWQVSQSYQDLNLSSFDAEFIHLAKKEQIKHVISKFWQDQHPVILKLDVKKLVGRLVEETNPGGTTKYFHLYSGKIPLNAVLEAFVCRAAIDFGSGALKIQVNAFDLLNNRLLPNPIMSKYIVLYLTEDIAMHHGIISKPMEHRVVTALKKLKDEAIAANSEIFGCSPVFSGIATEAFRKASNGLEILYKIERVLGISFNILSQEIEGELGFKTAKTCYPDVVEDRLIAWDSGNGSFQLTVKYDNAFYVYRGLLGHGTIRLILSKDVRGIQTFEPLLSGNPIAQDEIEQVLKCIHERLTAVPVWLSDRLQDKESKVVCFGELESAFYVVFAANAYLKKEEFQEEDQLSLGDVKEVLQAFVGYDDEKLKVKDLHHKTVTSAMLILAILEHFKIARLYFKRSLGVTSGMLISKDFWE